MTNKPEVVAWRWRKPIVNDQGEAIGATAWELSAEHRFLPWWTNEPLIRLSDYEALQAEYDRLIRYCKNGLECFANPCERHSGERTPPFSEFFERYGGQCLICVVDNNKTLQTERDQLRAEVEALRGQAHALHLVGHALGLPAGSDLTREVLPAIEALRKGTARYEAVRKLDPRQFAELWGACLSGDRLFDDSVDDLIDAAMAANNGAQ